jgi:hypothetical protein
MTLSLKVKRWYPFVSIQQIYFFQFVALGS